MAICERFIIDGNYTTPVEEWLLEVLDIIRDHLLVAHENNVFTGTKAVIYPTDVITMLAVNIVVNLSFAALRPANTVAQRLDKFTMLMDNIKDSSLTLWKMLETDQVDSSICN